MVASVNSNDKLILFPINAKKPRKGEASAEEIKKATQIEGRIVPVRKAAKRPRAMELTDDLKKFEEAKKTEAATSTRESRSKENPMRMTMTTPMLTPSSL